MSEPEEQPRKARGKLSLLASFLAGLVGTVLLSLILLVLLVGVVQPFIYEVPFRLAAGWLLHLWNVVPKIQFSADMFASGVAGIALAMAGLHWLGKWLSAQISQHTRTWTWRGTLALTLLVCVLFASSICGTGMVHQLGWLRTTKWTMDPMARSSIQSMKRAGNARILCGAALAYAEDNQGVLPIHLGQLLSSSYMSEPDFLGRTYDPRLRAEPDPWVYLGSGMRADSPSWYPVVAEPRSTGRDGKRVVVTLDAEAHFLSPEDYHDLLTRWRVHQRAGSKAGPPKP